MADTITLYVDGEIGTAEYLNTPLTQLQTNKAPKENPTFTGNVIIDSTGYISIPAGPTEDRHPNPDPGDMRFNTEEGKLEAWNNIKSKWEFVGSGSGQMLGEAEVKVFTYNSNTLSENIIIPEGSNASAVGPITVADGFSVSVPDGSRLIIL